MLFEDKTPAISKMARTKELFKIKIRDALGRYIRKVICLDVSESEA